MRDSDRDVALTVEQVLLGLPKNRVVRGGEEIRFLCPMHDDTRPSACYNREGGVWNCHGCGVHGGLTWGETPLAPLLGIHTEGVIPLPAAMEEIRQRRRKIEREREATEARKHEALQAYWRERRLSERLGRHEDVVAALEREGICRFAATHFAFGYADYHGTPALAIPWTFRGELRALQYRLLGGDVTQGRYRWHLGSRPTLFNADAVIEPHDDTMLVVEGAKKAACLWSYGATSVCAVVNKKGWRPEYARPFQAFDRVVFLPDPDAIGEAFEWARTVPGSRVALLPKKPDDLLVSTGGDVDLLDGYLKTAKVIS